MTQSPSTSAPEDASSVCRSSFEMGSLPCKGKYTDPCCKRFQERFVHPDFAVLVRMFGLVVSLILAICSVWLGITPLLLISLGTFLVSI